MSVAALYVLAWALAVVPVPQSLYAPPEGEVREAYEAAARELEAIEYGEHAFGRFLEPVRRMPAGHEKPDRAPLIALLQRRDPTPVVVELLDHADPRVRTLALLVLYDREEPQLLPHIAAALGDEAPTFPEWPSYTIALTKEGPLPREPPPPKSRSVAYVAKMLLQMYYDAAGLFSNGAWDAYWTPRSKRDFCASWFGVRLVRAHGGSSPVTGMQDTRIRHVRTAVGRLADVDRELTLLWLATRVSASRAAQEVFAPEAIRLAAARNLGRARLLEILRGVPPTSDPDLLPGAKGEHPCARIAWFVLGNAGALLDRGDVEELLELDARAEELADRNWSWPASGPMWRVAAAQLDPARALMHLEVAFERCGALDGFCRDGVLVWAWRLLGDGFDAAWTDRFWHEERERAHTPTQLLGALREDASPRARATFAALLRHPGLETADGDTLVQLARTANVWTYPPVLDEDEFRRLWHPSGLSRVRTAEQLARAAEQWPRETSAMLERMSAWRARLRATVSAELVPEGR